MREATLCFLTKGQPVAKVLLGLKKKGFGAGKYLGFGGKVEPHETIRAAAIRELCEEAGIQVAQKEIQKVALLTFLFPTKPSWNQTVHVFLATSWQGQAIESQEMKPQWFNIDKLPYGAMWQDAPHWLPLILSGKQIRASFTFADDNERVEQVSIKIIADGQGVEVV